MQTTNRRDFWEGAEMISVYTRKQAIEDGELVQLSGPGYEGDPEMPKTVAEAGFTIPVAMTKAAFATTVWPIGDGDASCRLDLLGQSIAGRLWDVAWMLRLKIRANPNTSRVRFAVYCVPNRGKHQPKMVELASVIGPDDDGRPCITIMLPHED